MASSPPPQETVRIKVGSAREEGWNIVDCRDEASSKETRCIVLMSMMRSSLRLR